MAAALHKRSRELATDSLAQTSQVPSSGHLSVMLQRRDSTSLR
jgi:hypothetical protein